MLPGDIFYDEIGKPIVFGVNTGHVGIVKSVEVHEDGSRFLRLLSLILVMEFNIMMLLQKDS